MLLWTTAGSGDLIPARKRVLEEDQDQRENGGDGGWLALDDQRSHDRDEEHDDNRRGDDLWDPVKLDQDHSQIRPEDEEEEDDRSYAVAGTLVGRGRRNSLTGCWYGDARHRIGARWYQASRRPWLLLAIMRTL